jgi:hypothetical protein
VAAEPIPFVQRIIIKAWGYLFTPGSQYYLPGKLQDGAGTITNLPADPSRSDAVGFDLGESIPDALGLLALGAMANGNAQGFIASASLAGLTGLAPVPDPNNPDLDGLTFTPDNDNPSSVTCALRIPALALSDGAWAIHQPELYVPNSGGCQAQPMLAAARVQPSDQNLALLKQLRDDLLNKGGAMGAWYVQAYYANQQALQNLLTLPLWNIAVNQYDGQGVWAAILAGIQSAQNTQPVTFPKSDASNALALVSAAQQVSADQAFITTIGQIVPYLSAYTDGKTYDQIIETVAAQTPPAAASAAAAAPGARTRAAGDVNPYAPQAIMGSWSGQFSASAQVFITTTFSITPGQGGAPPVFSCTAFQITLPGPSWSFNYSGDDVASKLEVFLQKTFAAKATQGLNTKIASIVNGGSTNDGIRNTLSAQLNAAVDAIWNADAA